MNSEKKVLGIIPARIGSTRIPKKMLEDLGGKTLIQRTYERSKDASKLDALVVATDSEEIAESARAVGAPVIMWPTPITSKNGTEGAAMALKQFTDFEPEIVSIIWGDEPLYPAEAIDDSITLLLDDENLQVSSIGDLIKDEEMWRRPSVVKVLTDFSGTVLYISRAPIPHPYTEAPVDVHHIIGVMTVRAPFLKTFLSLPQTPLEKREGVEQMRILENGYRMKIVKGDYGSLGVNTPEELEQVRKRFES